MSATPPPAGPPVGGGPPHPPPRQQPPAYPPPMPYPPAPEGRSVSFFVALFLALLLLISGGINIVLVLFSAIGNPASFAEAAIDESDAGYRVVAVGGEKGATANRVLRIPIEGAIAEGASPLIGAAGGTVSQVRRQLRLAANTKSIKGIILEVNSPGGGVTDSDEIHRMISKFRNEHKKPVVAYFGDMSASGGYYIAAACDKIYCRPTTITGSIGVIMSSYDLTEAFQKLGVKSEVIISPNTPYKDIMSMSRPIKPEERAILLSIVEEMYERFVTIVDDGREELTRDEVQALANGQIYSAGQAKANGLVDDILDPDELFAKVKDLAGIEKAQIVEQRRLPTLMETLVGTPGVSTSAGGTSASLAETAARYVNQGTGARFLYFWPGGR